MTASSSNDRSSFVLLQLGRMQFAVDSAIVAELAPPVRLHTFPHTTALIEGAIVRRGQIIPVYDVAPILTGGRAPIRRFYLVMKCDGVNGGAMCAIPVSGNCELRTGEPMPPPEGQAPYVKGILDVDEFPVEVLDLDKLLTGSQSNSVQPAEARG